MALKKRTVLILGGLFVLFIVFSILSIIYTERPEFCITCHLMDSYYASWKESAHSEINCLECHYEPTFKAHAIGKIKGLIEVAQYLSGKYPPRPQGHVSDSSCLRTGCHDKDSLNTKTINFKNSIEFSHAKHFAKLRADLELKCTNCHSQITSDKHIETDNNTCFICHFMNRKADQIISQCTKCHNQIESVGEHKEYIIEGGMECKECHSSKGASGGEVRVQVCYFCHADKEKINRIKDKALLHKTHIHEKSKIDCLSCHNFMSH